MAPATTTTETLPRTSRRRLDNLADLIAIRVKGRRIWRFSNCQGDVDSGTIAPRGEVALKSSFDLVAETLASAKGLGRPPSSVLRPALERQRETREALRGQPRFH
jgi:hypothetical protein